MNRESLRDLLKRHEGFREKPYLDCCGLYWRACTCEKKGCLTIGYGTNLDAGITEAEGGVLLDNRVAKVISYCREAYSWFHGLCDTRQNVIASMVYNLGAAGFSGFRKMLAAVAGKNFTEAANQMLLSRWSAQVKDRAVELAEMMREGDTLH